MEMAVFVDDWSSDAGEQEHLENNEMHYRGK